MLYSRTLITLSARCRSRSSLLPPTRSISNKIYIRWLPDPISKEMLENYLGSYGKVLSIAFFPRVQLKSTSAIVSFENINSALSAIDELDNALIFGRRVSVDFAKSGGSKSGYSPDKMDRKD